MRLLVLLLIAVPLYAHNGAVTTAAPVEGIVVDGDLGDWPDELPWHEIAIPSFGLRPYDDADFSGRFRLGYDAQGRSLYVGVEVTDGSRVVDGVGGQLSSDGCEIHLDVPHSTQDVPTVLRHAVWGNRRSILTPSGASQPFGDADVEWRRGDGQHIYEWEIDLSVLGDGDLHNRVIGMNVVVLDVDDDGSTRRVVWGQRYHKAPGNLSPDGLTDLRGDVVLTPEPVNDITVQTVSEIEHEALGRAWFRIESEAWDTPLDVVSDANTGVAHLQLPGGAYRLQSLHPPGSMVSLVVSSDSAYHTDVVVPRPRFEAIHAPPVDSTLGSGLRDGDWVNYGVADGVANVHRLHVGLQGELWITTGRGLLRFDGHMLHSYGHIENELLTGQAIGHDSDGRTWIGGSTGIGYFSNDSLWVCGAECGGPQGVVDSFELDVNGRLWLTVGGIGAMYFEDGYFHELTVAEGLASTEIRSMAGGPDGSIWFATDSGLSRWSDGEFTTYTTRDGLPSTEVYGVNVDSAGIVWIACTPDFAGAEGGLASYDGETFRTLSHDQMPQSVVFYPMIDGGGGFWVGTVDGVYRSDPGSLQFRPAPGVAYPYVFTLAEDAHGTMWAGTNGGLSRYARSRLRNLTTQDGFPPAAGAFEFLEDRNGLLWAPTVGGGIARYDGDRFRVFSVEDGLPAPFVQAAALDSTGQIWVATSAGAARLDGERFHPIPGQPTAFCTNIFVDSDERVWLSTFGDGVWIYDGSTWQNLTTATGLPTNEINQVLEARDGSYWLATEAGLVHLVDDDVEVFDEESGINPYISRVVEDGDGNVWVATQGGVSRYDG